ncbi:hypothetical protein J6590_093334 [Homalodisca vitripennis]|nr:hypothetical protein J6590_093334 [Homalodisca vitripennis]
MPPVLWPINRPRVQISSSSTSSDPPYHDRNPLSTPPQPKNPNTTHSSDPTATKSSSNFSLFDLYPSSKTP